MEILVPCFLFTFLGNEIVLFFFEGVIFRLTKPAVLLVIGTEIIGLTPMRALIDSAEYYLQIEDFNADKQIIENYLL